MTLREKTKSAKWRGTTASDGKSIGVSFYVDGGTVMRLRLDLASARSLEETLRHYLGKVTNSHSEKSSGKPSVEVSTQRE